MSDERKIVIPSEEEIASYGAGAAAGVESTPSGAQGEQASAEGSAGGSADAGNPSPAEAPASSRTEADEWKEKFLRAKAELLNYQKRADRDRQEAVRFANADLVRTLLPILDDLDRLVAAGSDSAASVDA